MKKKIVFLISILIMSLSFSLLSYAAQSPRWHEQNGVWYLQNEQGTGNTVNSWFQDLDGSWYLLAPGDGHMYAGLIHDTLTDRWYFCQTEHDGWYGRMAHTDGLYTVNGQQVYLTFVQEHLGYFGAITSGLESLRATGVVTQDVAGLPTESASAGTPETNVDENKYDDDYRDPVTGKTHAEEMEERIRAAQEQGIYDRTFGD